MSFILLLVELMTLSIAKIAYCRTISDWWEVIGRDVEGKGRGLI
jgi:hypothetical protein